MMIQVGHEDIVCLTQQIWHSMLQLPLQPAECALAPNAETDGLNKGQCLSACVQMTGAWTGAVRLDCSRRFARRTAAAFLGLGEMDVLREQMLDALGEVTNMVAGGVKPLLPRPCQISLPSVVDGNHYELNIRKGQMLLTSDFDSEGEKLTVTLFEAITQEKAGEGAR
jgi:chemotaxis protein CheX